MASGEIGLQKRPYAAAGCRTGFQASASMRKRRQLRPRLVGREGDGQILPTINVRRVGEIEPSLRDAPSRFTLEHERERLLVPDGREVSRLPVLRCSAVRAVRRVPVVDR